MKRKMPGWNLPLLNRSRYCTFKFLLHFFLYSRVHLIYNLYSRVHLIYSSEFVQKKSCPLSEFAHEDAVASAYMMVTQIRAVDPCTITQAGVTDPQAPCEGIPPRVTTTTVSCRVRASEALHVACERWEI